MPFERLGVSGGDSVTIALPVQDVQLSVNLTDLRAAYENPLKTVLA